MRIVLVMLVASACGFSPNSASVDARDQHDARAVIDAPIHVPPDSFVFEDAPTPPAFDPASCPSGYAFTVTASPGSRYRITGASSFMAQYATCRDDHPGWTHLAVLDTTQEATQIHAALDGNAFYVGAVQPKNQATPATGWLQLTGEAVPVALWQGGQPNDNGDNDENNEQNLTAVDDNSGLMNDVSGSFQYLGVCECDGKPIAAAAIDALAN